MIVYGLQVWLKLLVLHEFVSLAVAKKPTSVATALVLYRSKIRAFAKIVDNITTAAGSALVYTNEQQLQKTILSTQTLLKQRLPISHL